MTWRQEVTEERAFLLTEALLVRDRIASIRLVWLAFDTVCACRRALLRIGLRLMIPWGRFPTDGRGTNLAPCSLNIDAGCPFSFVSEFACLRPMLIGREKVKVVYLCCRWPEIAFRW